MPVRAFETRLSDAFKTDLDGLRDRFPRIDEAVQEFRDILAGYSVPHFPLTAVGAGVFARRVDYRPLGTEGAGRLLVTYLQTDNLEAHQANPMSNGRWIFTLLTVQERPL